MREQSVLRTSNRKKAQSSAQVRRAQLIRAANSAAMRKRVADAVVHGKGQGGRKIKTALNPGTTRGYPSYMLGSRAKVPRESRPQGWGLHKVVRDAIGNPHIPGRVINEALDKKSAIEYGAEWSEAGQKAKAKKHAKVRIAARVESTRQKMDQWAEDIKININNANARNGWAIREDLNRRITANLRKGRKTLCVDLGCGAGKTSFPVVQNIAEAKRQHLQIALVDVASTGMKNAKKELVSMGVPEANIQIIQCNFGDLSKSREIKALAGKADIVYSGAALHHLSRSETIFGEVNKMLKSGGSFKFWDWSHPAWRAPKLVVAPRGAKVSVNGRAYSYNGKVYRAERGEAFVSRTAPSGTGRFAPRSELAQTREMLSTWISLLNFPLSERRVFERWFDSQVRQGKSIQFEQYLKGLESKFPSKPATIEVMEAHKTFENYHRAMRGVGLLPGKPSFSPDSALLVHYSATKK